MPPSPKSDLKRLANPEKAKTLQRYFKTGKGDYGEGDIFIGLTSRQIKDVAKIHLNLTFKEIQALLGSKIHEERAYVLRILVRQYEKAKKDPKKRKEISDFYLKNAALGNINNWDLFDLSAPNIVGDFLLDKDRKPLYTLAKSEKLWGRRISILSTLAFIRKGQFEDTLKISEMLLNDRHDLIHKAVGWMLREVGNRDKSAEVEFLDKFHKEMPRVMLRYAIEKMDKTKREKYLRG
ncbi:MAG: DNA alkylation repair protein [Candidatus Aenigmatarchaeota archaeon]